MLKIILDIFQLELGQSIDDQYFQGQLFAGAMFSGADLLIIGC